MSDMETPSEAHGETPEGDLEQLDNDEVEAVEAEDSPPDETVLDAAFDSIFETEDVPLAIMIDARLEALEGMMADNVEAVSNMVTDIAQSVSRLQSDFESKIKYEETNRQMVDRLHDELQEYRSGMVLNILRPMLNDVLALHDDVAVMVDAYAEDDTVQELAQDHALVARLLADFEATVGDIEELLVRQGFELYHTDEDTLDRALHSVQKTVITDDPELSGRIARRIRKGVRYDGRVVRPEVVDVYRYKAS